MRSMALKPVSIVTPLRLNSSPARLSASAVSLSAQVRSSTACWATFCRSPLAWMASAQEDEHEEASAFTDYLEKYSVHVAKADFKFNAAHFVAYKGFRER